MNLLRQIAWKLFKWPSVVLIDNDEEETCRLVRTSPSGRPYVYRDAAVYSERVAYLREDGTFIGGPPYCKRWVDARWCKRPTVTFEEPKRGLSEWGR